MPNKKEVVVGEGKLFLLEHQIKMRLPFLFSLFAFGTASFIMLIFLIIGLFGKGIFDIRSFFMVTLSFVGSVCYTATFSYLLGHYLLKVSLTVQRHYQEHKTVYHSIGIILLALLLLLSIWWFMADKLTDAAISLVVPVLIIIIYNQLPPKVRGKINPVLIRIGLMNKP